MAVCSASSPSSLPEPKCNAGRDGEVEGGRGEGGGEEGGEEGGRRRPLHRWARLSLLRCVRLSPRARPLSRGARTGGC